MASVQPIPEGFHTVTPYLSVKGAVKAIDFYARAFGAVERYRLPGPNDTIGHAELTIGNSIVMLSDEWPEGGVQSPETLGASTVGFIIYVTDADAAFAKAVDAGATVFEPVENKFYGERAGTVVDPFGYRWSLMTHVEDVSSEEVAKRMAEFMASTAPAD